MTEDLSDLPPVLRIIAEECGLGVALKLAAEFGGTSVNLPRKATDQCVLVRVIGEADAAKLIQRFGSSNLEIPLGPFGNRKRVWQAIRANLREGRSNAKTARAVGIHKRTVVRHRSQMKRDEDNDLPLFDRLSKGD